MDKCCHVYYLSFLFKDQTNWISTQRTNSKIFGTDAFFIFNSNRNSPMSSLDDIANPNKAGTSRKCDSPISTSLEPSLDKLLDSSSDSSDHLESDLNRFLYEKKGLSSPYTQETKNMKNLFTPSKNSQILDKHKQMRNLNTPSKSPCTPLNHQQIKNEVNSHKRQLSLDGFFGVGNKRKITAEETLVKKAKLTKSMTTVNTKLLGKSDSHSKLRRTNPDPTTKLKYENARPKKQCPFYKKIPGL